MCPVQVPRGGFQVAGRSVCPVSPEQTPRPKKEDGKKTPSQHHTRLARASLAVHLSALPSAEPSQEMGGILREQAQIFLLGGGGREGRLLECGGVDCPHQIPLPFSHPSPFLLLSFSSAWLWRDPLFVSQAVERLLLTPPPPGSLSFPFSFSVSLPPSKPPPLCCSVFLVFSQSLFLACLRSVKQPHTSSFKGGPFDKVNKGQRQSAIRGSFAL